MNEAIEFVGMFGANNVSNVYYVEYSSNDNNRYIPNYRQSSGRVIED